MKCTELQQQLDAYLAGNLPIKQCEALEKHLETCAQCTKLLLVEDQELEKILKSDWYIVKEPPYLQANVMQRVHGKKPITWLWWVLAWVGYISIWTIGVFLVLLRHYLPQVMEAAALLGTFVRSTLNVALLVIDSLQFFRLSTFGVGILVSSVLLVFAFIGLLSKGEALQ